MRSGFLDVRQSRRGVWYTGVLQATLTAVLMLVSFTLFRDRSWWSGIVWVALAASLVAPLQVLRRFLRHASDESTETIQIAYRIVWIGYAPLWVALFLLQICARHAR